MVTVFRQSQRLRLGTEYSISKRGILGIQGNYQLESSQNNNNRITSFFDSENALSRNQ